MASVIVGSDNFDSGSYTSSTFSFTYNITYSFTHGLGAVPKNVTVYLICTSANNGYAVGDTIIQSAVDSYSGGGLQAYANSTTLNLIVQNANGAPYITSATTRARINNPYTGWVMQVKATLY